MTGTPAQLAALDAWIEAGSGKAAAHMLGITHHSWRRRMANLRRSNDAAHNGVLAYLRGLEARRRAS